MSEKDFWNLAGRAGRWGKEFQGNIFCIDAAQAELWGANGPPREKKRYPIRRTTDDVLDDPAAIIDFIKAKAPLETAQKQLELDYVFAYLTAMHVRHGSIKNAPWANRYTSERFSELADVIAETVEGLHIPLEILERNPGISPFAMDDLLDYFINRDKPVEELLPVDPASDDALMAYVRIFGRLSKRICPKLGPSKRSYVLALLVTRWMRGYPLSRLISERLSYRNRQSGNNQINISEIIRSVMNDVEQIARFEAPKGLACYRDILRFHLSEIGRSDLLDQLPDLGIFLEFGVAQQTQVSLIGLGLSRTSSIFLSELIASDILNEAESIAWLIDNRELWSKSSLPALVKREIEHVLSICQVQSASR